MSDGNDNSYKNGVKMIVDSLKYSLTEELRIENNAISGHILPVLFSSRRPLLSILLASCHIIQHSRLFFQQTRMFSTVQNIRLWF